MHLRTRPGSNRKAIGPQLLLALALATVSWSMAGKALGLERLAGERLAGERQAVERWKHPPARAGAGQFRALRQGPNGPNAAGPNGAGPNANESSSRAGAINQRAPVGNIQAEGRPFEVRRPSPNPTGRGGAELQRLESNPAGRGPAELQRPGLPGQSAARGPFQRGPAGGFARRALAERSLQGGGRFGRGQLAGRFQARPFAGLIARRPLIGERGFTGVPPAGENRFLTNEMVFHVPPNVSPQTVDTVARRLGLSTVASQSFNLSGGTLFRFRITDGRPVADVIRALESENIGVAQPNYVFRLQQDASLAAASGRGDPSQYVVDKLRLVDVHRIAIGSNVLVAVIDSEIDGKHPELVGAVVDEFDAIGNHDKPACPRHRHGGRDRGPSGADRHRAGRTPARYSCLLVGRDQLRAGHQRSTFSRASIGPSARARKSST